jgi:hypothetical protein
MVGYINHPGFHGLSQFGESHRCYPVVMRMTLVLEDIETTTVLTGDLSTMTFSKPPSLVDHRE